jgi:hypothetical protein
MARTSTPTEPAPAPLVEAITAFMSNGKVILEGARYRNDEPFVVRYPERFVPADSSQPERHRAILAMNKTSAERAERNAERYATAQRRSLVPRLARRPTKTKLETAIAGARKRQADQRDEYDREDREARQREHERQREDEREQAEERERERLK